MQKGEWSDIVAIASRDKSKAEKAAKELGIPQAYGSYEELLASPEIEAVYNPLPNHMHVPWSIKAAEAGKLHWLNTEFSLGLPFNIWMGVIGGTFVVLSSHGAEQLIVQRVLACKTVADGRKALVLSAVVILPLFLVFLLVGVMLWGYYQQTPLTIPIPEIKSGSGIKANDYIYPIFMMTAVPHVLKGFLIVAILSAAMSSVSSALTSLASVSTMDFVKPLSRVGRSEGFFLNFSKASTVVWAALLIVVAYLSREVEYVLNAAFYLTAGDEVPLTISRNGEQLTIKVQPADNPAAPRQTATPGGIDEPPCRLARWVGKSRPRGARADWLGCLPCGADLHQPFCDLGALGRDTAQPRLDKDPPRVDPAMAIGKRHRSAVDHMMAAAAVEGGRRDEHVSNIHAIGAGVHP